MRETQHIYTYRYDDTESDLCKLESKYIFNNGEKNKQLFSNIKIKPSTSAFIKKRIDVITSSKDYPTLLSQIRKENIKTDGFKIEYVVLAGDNTGNAKRLQTTRDIAYCIDTFPDYYNPSISYGVCIDKGVWYFGLLIKNDFSWLKHKHKPHSYSNAINMNIAKALVNIATESNIENTILDGCCGVGTIMLEACYAGFTIDGCDISFKTCNNARENIKHFNYNAEVYCSDIKDIQNRYDAVILDLPYNLYTAVTNNEIFSIIRSSKEIAKRIVIVSGSDITNLLHQAELEILDHCSVSKRGKVNFTREIWVCESKN